MSRLGIHYMSFPLIKLKMIIYLFFFFKRNQLLCFKIVKCFSGKANWAAWENTLCLNACDDMNEFLKRDEKKLYSYLNYFRH